MLGHYAATHGYHMTRGITLYLPPAVARPAVFGFDTAHQHDYFAASDGTNRDNRADEKVADKSTADEYFT